MQVFRPIDYEVLLVEETDEEARLLGAALEQQGYPFARVRDIDQAMDVMGRARPALCVIDARSPEDLELCRRVRAHPWSRQLPIILLSQRASESDRVAGFESGADDYLVKPFSMPELMLRIRARLVERFVRPATRSAGVLRCGLLEIAPDSFRVLVSGQPVRLSILEFRLLVALVQAGGEIRTRRDLEITRGARRRESRTAIDSRIKRLRKKLGPAGRYIETVRGLGYRLAVP